MRRKLELALIVVLCLGFALALVYLYPHPERHFARVFLSMILASGAAVWLLSGRLRVLCAPVRQQEFSAATPGLLVTFVATGTLWPSSDVADAQQIARLWYAGLLAGIPAVSFRVVALAADWHEGMGKGRRVLGTSVMYLLGLVTLVFMLWVCSDTRPLRAGRAPWAWRWGYRPGPTGWCVGAAGRF